MNNQRTNYRDIRRAATLDALDHVSLRRLARLKIINWDRSDEWQLPCLSIWTRWMQRFDDSGTKAMDAADYRFVRQVLGVNGLPHSRRMLAQVCEAVPCKRISKIIFEPILGKCGVGDMEYLRELKGDSRRTVSPSHEKASLEQLLSLFPPELAEAIRATLRTPVEPKIEPPQEVHMARVLAMPKEWQPLLAGMLLRHSVRRLNSRSTVTCLSGIASVVAHANGDDLVGAFCYLRSEQYRGRASYSQRIRWTELFRSEMLLARRWITELAKRAGAIVALPDLSTLESRKYVSSKKSSNEASPERVEAVAERLRHDKQIDALVDFRMKSVMALAEGYRASVARGISEGAVEVAFRVRLKSHRFHWDMPFRAVRLDRAWEIALERSQARKVAYLRFFQRHLEKARSLLAGGAVPWVCLWDRSFSLDDEVSPFFIDLYRFSLVEPQRQLSDLQRTLANQRVIELRFSRPTKRIADLLATPRECTALSTALRAPDILTSPILIPVEQLESGMLLAGLSLFISRDAAPRGSETLQLRCEPGAIDTRSVFGREVMWFGAIPKGGIEAIRKELSDETAELLFNVVQILNRNLAPTERSASGNPTVPQVRYGGHHGMCKNMVGRFVFQNGRRGLNVGDLNILLRCLMIGIADVCYHGERAISATRAALTTRDEKLVRKLIDHGPYGLSFGRYNVAAPIMAAAMADLGFRVRASRRRV